MIDPLDIPGDAGIRQILLKKLSKKHSHETGTVIIEELGLCRGKVRVDVAVVNGSLHGYEIKSDRDSLTRLSRQVRYYGKVVDRATLVVGEHHLPKALDTLPDWWEVVRISPSANEPSFKTVRRGKKNPCGDPRSLVELLWYDDAIALLEEHNIARGVRGKPRRIVWDRICEHFSFREIAEAVRTQLKARVKTQSVA
ncbi:MAG: sce7726 family protein [Desulfarculaceae bacterium]|nr:sce7726 family protein [Desulfarculaceae bacterium]